MKRAHKISPPQAARLFTEPERPGARPPDALQVNIDGAARGNPGPAAYGVLFRRLDGSVVHRFSKYIGRATNNVAEYYALIAALDYAAAHGITKVLVHSDSLLLVNQMRGIYKVKNPELRQLHERASKLARGLAYFRIDFVPRENNARADVLANEALDQTKSRTSGAREKYLTGRLLSEKDLEDEQKYTRGGQRIRARYRNGALHPAEPLDLPEESEVEITISRPSRR